MVKTYACILVLIGWTLLISVPIASAVPQVLPVSSNALAVSGTADYIYFGCPSNTVSGGTTGMSLTLTGPFGDQMKITGNGGNCQDAGGFVSSGPAECIDDTGLINSAHYHARFRLDGTAATGATSAWSVTGDLAGAPADGTWRVDIEEDITTALVPLQVFRPICLHVGNKDLNRNEVFPFGGPRPCSLFWNQHVPSVPSTPEACQFITMGVVNAEQDPNDFRFFVDAPEIDTEPHPFTTESTVTCPSTLNVNGLWSRGTQQTLNTFARFYAADGNQIGMMDLSAISGSTQTTNTDKGAGDSGSHSDTVPYNNAAGTSYQLVVSAGGSGSPQRGTVLFAPPNQCQITPPTIAFGFLHEEDFFDITVSQAQCSGDETGFSIDVDLASGLSVSTNIIYIQDADTGTTVLQFTPAFSIGTAVFYDSKLLPTGEYAAIGVLTVTGAGAGTYFDSQAFNVPLGTCLTPSELSSILTAINNVNSTCVGCTVTGGGFLQGTALGATSVENVLLILLIAALGYWIWSKEKRISTRIIGTMIVFLAMLISFNFLGAWVHMVKLSVFLAGFGAFLLIKGAIEFANIRDKRQGF